MKWLDRALGFFTALAVALLAVAWQAWRRVDHAND